MEKQSFFFFFLRKILAFFFFFFKVMQYHSQFGKTNAGGEWGLVLARESWIGQFHITFYALVFFILTFSLGLSNFHNVYFFFILLLLLLLFGVTCLNLIDLEYRYASLKKIKKKKKKNPTYAKASFVSDELWDISGLKMPGLD